MSSWNYVSRGVFDRTKNNSVREKSIVEHRLETLYIEEKLTEVLKKLNELSQYYTSKGYSDLFIEMLYDDEDKARVYLNGWLPEDDKEYAERLDTLDKWDLQVRQREEAEFERLKAKLGK